MEFGDGNLPQIPQFKRNSTRKVAFICLPMVKFGTALTIYNKQATDNFCWGGGPGKWQLGHV